VVFRSTAAAKVTGRLADEARAHGEHLQGHVDSGDSGIADTSESPGRELRESLLGSNGNAENVPSNSDLAATVEDLQARLAQQETQFELLSKQLGATRASLRARGCTSCIWFI